MLYEYLGAVLDLFIVVKIKIVVVFRRMLSRRGIWEFLGVRKYFLVIRVCKYVELIGLYI